MPGTLFKKEMITKSELVIFQLRIFHLQCITIQITKRIIIYNSRNKVESRKTKEIILKIEGFTPKMEVYIDFKNFVKKIIQQRNFLTKQYQSFLYRIQ